MTYEEVFEKYSGKAFGCARFKVIDANRKILKEGDDIMYISRLYGGTPCLRKGILLRIGYSELVVRVTDYDPTRNKKVVRLTGYKWRGRPGSLQYRNVVKLCE